MGMAASQARYLALTARKTNTEWEGQQINQARTALANQSANLFNRLLGMEVPNPPSKTDYTELQYAYSDSGSNDSVIDHWEKITNSNPDYNYIVKHYYMAELFKGSEKLLQDPQVQMGDVIKEFNFNHSNPVITWNDDGEITVTYKVDNIENSKTYQKISQEQVEGNPELESALRNFETAKNMAKADGTLTTDAVYGSYDESTKTWHFYIANDYNKLNKSDIETYGDEFKKELRDFELKNNIIKDDEEPITEDIFFKQYSDGSWSFTYEKSSTITEASASADPSLASALRTFEENSGIIPAGGDLVYDNIKGYHFGSGWEFYVADEETESSINIVKPADNIDYSTVYGPSFVGNSKLTELNELIVNDSIDQVADLAQILRDCPDSAINQYVSFDSQGNLVYTGNGIYTFDMYGKTYYTTSSDLMKSVSSMYNSATPIEVQTKLPYYTAGLVSTKMEETNKALLETDKNGRFTSVKFDNDSNTYALKVEQITNEVAYEDAMNQYLYKKAQYEKTIADINAQTSIIQKEDRTLELRLKQLDTEQNALATEMDAVKKVIKDNVEKTFKTFSD